MFCLCHVVQKWVILIFCYIIVRLFALRLCLRTLPQTLEPPEALHWINSHAYALAFPLSRFYCFSSFTLVALQLVSTPAVGQSADVTEPVVCGDARPLVCDGDVPVVTVTASTQQQQAPWTAQDSCTGGCSCIMYRFYSILSTF